MEIKAKNNDIFPAEVQELLQMLYSVGFFEDSMLIGSWVMPLYQELLGIKYILRTLDIDFAVKLVRTSRIRQADIEQILIARGYLPVMSETGIQKFTREIFTIEFITHRRGGRAEEAVSIKKWNLTACPLPFVDVLLGFSFIIDFGKYKIRAPLPEAFFVHKLITAQRRPGRGKRDKDIEQCAIIADKLDAVRLKAVIGSMRLSKQTRKTMKTSCETIDFPPHKLWLS